MFVRLQEVTLMKEKKDASSAADLIAAHDGKVISIVTREGTPQVHAGAKVKKGDVLISGRSDRRWRCNSEYSFCTCERNCGDRGKERI